VEIGGVLRLQEIEEVASRFRVCPKCNSTQGFWLGVRRDHAYVLCKGCGAKFELFEVYRIDEESKGSRKTSFFRKYIQL